MAIAPAGTKQKTYYVREDIARIVAMIGARLGRRESDIATEAFDLYIRSVLTDEELRVFGYKQENVDGNEDGADGFVPRPAGGRASGSKKRDRKSVGPRRRHTE